MNLHYSERFRRSYESAPRHIQRAFDRRIALLIHNLRHPSLRAKKYDAANDIWQARVNGGWRFECVPPFTHSVLYWAARFTMPTDM